jgi:hypothetical protein
MFLKKGYICVVYMDDTIFAGPDAKILEKEIRSLVVALDECVHSFQLRDEGEVGGYLAIRIEKQKGNAFILTQTGLIEKVIKAGGMEDCNKCANQAETTPMGADIDGEAFNDTWEYASVVGMLMYLASNTRPVISYAIHQAARHSHGTRNSHALVVKRILR